MRSKIRGVSKTGSLDLMWISADIYLLLSWVNVLQVNMGFCSFFLVSLLSFFFGPRTDRGKIEREYGYCLTSEV